MGNDKIIEELKEWQKNTQEVMNNLTTFVEGITKDLTPEQKAMVDEHMKELNTDNLKKEMSKVTDKMNEEMSKFKF